MSTSSQAVRFDAASSDYRTYVVGGATPLTPGGELEQELVFRTLDASGNQIREGTRFAAIDEAVLFPVTGPINVSGVHRGDTVGIEIVSIEPDPIGHCWTRPGIGFGPDVGFHVRAVDCMNPTLNLGNAGSWALPKRLHVGTLGVSPASWRVARDLGAYGGNLDTVHLEPGATLWVSAQMDGAGIFVGDVHLAIGDAEICGSGVEVAAEVRVRVRLANDFVPVLPVVTSGRRTWVIGVGNSMEEALKKAVDRVLLCVEQYLHVSSADAYLAVAQLLEVEICQVVNPKRSVAVSLRDGLDSCLGPHRDREPVSLRSAGD